MVITKHNTVSRAALHKETRPNLKSRINKEDKSSASTRSRSSIIGKAKASRVSLLNSNTSPGVTYNPRIKSYSPELSTEDSSFLNSVSDVTERSPSVSPGLHAKIRLVSPIKNIKSHKNKVTISKSLKENITIHHIITKKKNTPIPIKPSTDDVSSNEDNSSEDLEENKVELAASQTDKTYEELLQFQGLPNLDELSESSIPDDWDWSRESQRRTSFIKSQSLSHTSKKWDDLEYENIYPDEIQQKGSSILTLNSSEIEDNDDFDDHSDDDYHNDGNHESEEGDNDDDDLSNLSFSQFNVEKIKDEVTDLFEQPTINDLDNELKFHFIEPEEFSEKKIKEFVVEIIEKAVTISERNVKKVELFDKLRLYEHLMDKVFKYKSENVLNYLLNKTIADVFRRRGNYSQIKPIDDENIRNYTAMRYKEALDEVDYWLKRKMDSENTRIRETRNLIEEENIKTLEVEKMIQRLNDLIETTILKRFENSERLNHLVNDLLIKMNKMRDQISVLRTQFILKQNTYATYMMKLEELDIIGDGLTLQQYLSVQEEVTKLNHKVEARNNKFKANLNNFLHTMSHMRCRGKLMRSNLVKANMELKLKLSKFDELRNDNYNEHKKHSQLYQSMQSLKQQSGILHYPLLMKDYDNTIEYLIKKRSQVKELKIQKRKLLEKIEKIEKQL